MTTQTQTTSAIRPTSFFAFPLTDRPLDEVLKASSLDYGFDINEEELAKELLAPITLETGTQLVHPEEEICAMHFLS